MQIRIDDAKELTTDSAMSSYGIPALRVNDDSPSDYGSADTLPDGRRAAEVVAAFGRPATGDDRDAAAKFLRQWPEGPQI